jgi:hypothetical protein
MPAIRFGIAAVVVAMSWGAATAQPPPYLGGPVPPGQLYGYSPLVHTIEPFPSRTSGYALSIFGPNGGRRVHPSLVVNPRRPCHTVIIEVRDAPRPAPALLPAAALEPVGPVARPLPGEGLHRFNR